MPCMALRDISPSWPLPPKALSTSFSGHCEAFCRCEQVHFRLLFSQGANGLEWEPVFSLQTVKAFWESQER